MGKVTVRLTEDSMDIKNTRLTEFDGELNLPKTSVDRILNKDNGFFEDERISALAGGLVELYTHPAGSTFNGASHNSIFRGKSLGSSVSAKQWSAIGEGTFDNMFIGDFWSINGVYWRIAAFNYYMRKGPTANVVTAPHVVIVPDKSLGLSKMNSTATTTGAYAGSDFRTGNNGNTGLATAKTAIENAFGATHIMIHKNYFAKTVSADAIESDGAWYDSDVDLMNEHQVYGGKLYESAYSKDALLPHVKTIDTTQFPLFMFAPQFTIGSATDGTRGVYWLRNSVAFGSFAIVDYTGLGAEAYANGASNVRPYFCIYKP